MQDFCRSRFGLKVEHVGGFRGSTHFAVAVAIAAVAVAVAVAAVAVAAVAVVVG